jgi:hypothetical protein
MLTAEDLMLMVEVAWSLTYDAVLSPDKRPVKSNKKGLNKNNRLTSWRIVQHHQWHVLRERHRERVADPLEPSHKHIRGLCQL